MVLVAAAPGCIRHAAVPRARPTPVVAVGVCGTARRVLAVVRRNGIQPRTEREVARAHGRNGGSLGAPIFCVPTKARGVPRPPPRLAVCFSYARRVRMLAPGVPAGA